MTVAVPSLRAKVVPRLRVALDTMASVARIRRKRLELFGANLLGELLFALVLGAPATMPAAVLTKMSSASERSARRHDRSRFPGGLGPPRRASPPV